MPNRSSQALLFFSVLLGASACGTVTDRGAFGAPSEPTDQEPGGFDTPKTPPGENEDGCAEDAKLVYVLSLEGDIYSFAPAAKKFTKIGPLDCASSSGETLVPIAMGVDRAGTAWVNMRVATSTTADGELFEVSTKDASCKPSGIRGKMGGMGFSLNEGTKDQETLFLIGAGPNPFVPALLKADFKKKQLVPISELGERTDLELTGTGDGRLYGFLMNIPLELARVDKKSSSFSDRVSLSEITPPVAPMFAFSFWGGDFYFYTAQDTSMSKTSTVHRYNTTTKEVEVHMTNIGFHIVGAGVSTCAPVSQPK